MAGAVEEGEAGDDKSGGGVISVKKSAPSIWLTNFHRYLMRGVVHTIVAPIERAKLLLQTQESNLTVLAGGPHRRFKGMIDCILRTVME